MKSLLLSFCLVMFMFGLIGGATILESAKHYPDYGIPSFLK